MNRYLILIVLILDLSCNSTGTHEQKELIASKKSTKVKREQTSLNQTPRISNDDIQVSQIKIGETVRSLKKIGSPDSIKLKTSDFDIPDLKRYYFKRSYFEVDQDSTIYGFSIEDSSFVLLDKFKIRIGDSMESVFKTVQKYIDYKDDMSVSKENILRLRIGDSDDYLMFTFKNGKLLRVETWHDV